MLTRFFSAALALFWLSADAQTVDFESSNLPIVRIDTGDREIPDEPKVPARMAVIDNGPGQRNAVTDAPTDYDGLVGIEVRGAGSQSFPKKQYGFETRDADGENNNVSLLGLPRENDWILQAPYSDKSLMRNVLAYGLARSMGRYASRTRFVEVVLNGRYDGVYVLMEKIKRDDARVDIARLRPDETAGDDLTGGYIVEIDRTITGGGWTSPFAPAFETQAAVFYDFDTPDADEIAPEQAAYIEAFMTDFEAVMASDTYEDPGVGFTSIVDLGSFVDYVISVELGRNVDGYRLSTFLHKDKDSNDPRLRAGPVWDYNTSFGNAHYYGGERTDGYQWDYNQPEDPWPVAFWWPRMARSAPFQTALAARWSELRAGPLHTDSVLAVVDTHAATLAEAQARNFERWPVLGEYVFPNWFVGQSYAEEVDYLKGWLTARLGWLDESPPFVVAVEDGAADGAPALSAPYPNPARGRSAVTLTTARPEAVRLDLIDARGRRLAVVFDGVAVPTPQRIEVPVSGLPSGVYRVRLTTQDGVATRALTVLR